MKILFCMLVFVIGFYIIYDILIYFWLVVFLYNGELYFVNVKMFIICKVVMVCKECVCMKVLWKSKLIDEFEFIGLVFVVLLKEMIKKFIYDIVVLGFRDNFIFEFVFFW